MISSKFFKISCAIYVLFFIPFLNWSSDLTAFRYRCSLAPTATRSRPAARFLMLGSVIYHRIVLIGIIRRGRVDA